VGYVIRATGTTTFAWQQLAHSDLSGIGSNAHSVIDTHLGSTSNPHSVDWSDVSAGHTSAAHSGVNHSDLNDDETAQHVDWAAAAAGTIHTDNYIEGGAGTDTTAIHDDTANEITAITPKTSLAASDEFILEDSGASYVKKAVTFANIEASISLANLGTRTHASLSDAPTDAHHTRYALTEDLDSSEISQLQNIDMTTISVAQWDYLGDLNQSIDTTGTPSFVSLTVTAGNLLMNGSGSDDERLRVPYLTGVPTSVDNGSIWIESDGVHAYYNGTEKILGEEGGGDNLGNHTATQEIDMTGSWYPMLDLNPSSTDASQKIIDITPSAALVGTGNWYGYWLDGSALDPASIPSVNGMYIDFSGIDLTNSPAVKGLTVVVPSTLNTATQYAGQFAGDGHVVLLCTADYGLHVDSGDVLVDDSILGNIDNDSNRKIYLHWSRCEVDTADTDKAYIDISANEIYITGTSSEDWCVAADFSDILYFLKQMNSGKTLTLTNIHVRAYSTGSPPGGLKVRTIENGTTGTENSKSSLGTSFTDYSFDVNDVTYSFGDVVSVQLAHNFVAGDRTVHIREIGFTYTLT
jgi:hypothetical protein